MSWNGVTTVGAIKSISKQNALVELKKEQLKVMAIFQ